MKIVILLLIIALCYSDDTLSARQKARLKEFFSEDIILYDEVPKRNEQSDPQSPPTMSAREKARLKEFFSEDIILYDEVPKRNEHSDPQSPPTMSAGEKARLNEFFSEEIYIGVPESNTRSDPQSPPTRERKKFILNDEANFWGDSGIGKNSDCIFNETEHLNQRIYPHVKRFVNMFLKYSTLLDENLSNNHESDLIFARLDIRISAKYLLALQQFHRDERQLSFEELDECLSDIFYHSQLGRVDGFLAWINQKLDGIMLKVSFWNKWSMPSIPTMPRDYSFGQLCYLIIFLTFFAMLAMGKMSLTLIMFQVLIAITLVDGFQEYHRRIAVEEAKQFQQMQNNQDYQLKCNPKNRRWYTRLDHYWNNVDCTKMLAEASIHYSSHVSLAECLYGTYLGVFVVKTSESLGAASEKVSKAVVGDGWIVNATVKPILSTFIFFGIVFFILLYFGKVDFMFKFWPFTTFRIGPSENRTHQNQESHNPVSKEAVAPPINYPPINVNIVNQTSSRRPSITFRKAKQRVTGAALKTIEYENKEEDCVQVSRKNSGRKLLTVLSPTSESSVNEAGSFTVESDSTSSVSGNADLRATIIAGSLTDENMRSKRVDPHKACETNELYKATEPETGTNLAEDKIEIESSHNASMDFSSCTNVTALDDLTSSSNSEKDFFTELESIREGLKSLCEDGLDDSPKASPREDLHQENDHNQETMTF